MQGSLRLGECIHMIIIIIIIIKAQTRSLELRLSLNSMRRENFYDF